MDVAVTQFAPIDELDAQFETALCSGKHFLFADTEQLVEFDKGRDSRLAHADGADFFGFNQRYFNLFTGAKPRQRRASHPASGSAPHDDDMFYGHISSPFMKPIAL